MKKICSSVLLCGIIFSGNLCYGAQICMPVVDIDGGSHCAISFEKVVEKLNQIEILKTQTLPQALEQETNIFVKSAIRNAIGCLGLSDHSINRTAVFQRLHNGLNKLREKKQNGTTTDMLLQICENILSW